MDLKELYQEIILDHGKNPRNKGKCDGYTNDAKAHNPLCGDKVHIYLKLNKDEEIEYAMKATKALGADYVTAELTSEENTKRISHYAEKNKVNVGYHAHLQASDTAWDFALNNSKNNFINLDIGHYIAAGKKNTKETLLKFIEKNHARICSLHLKDRQYAKTLNVIATDNQIWGEGDTPITEVLRLVRDNSYKFTSTIELEYRIPEGSNRIKEVIKCYDYCKQALIS